MHGSRCSQLWSHLHAMLSASCCSPFGSLDFLPSPQVYSNSARCGHCVSGDCWDWTPYNSPAALTYT